MNQYKHLAQELKRIFDENCAYLCRLDADAGDGDHGVTISRGFTGAWGRVSELQDDTEVSEYFKQMGYGLLEYMGGASGPIFSTFFIQMAIVLKDGKKLDGSSFYQAVAKAVEAITELSGARPGDKTMMDSLYGALCNMESNPSDDLSETLELALEGAIKGSQDTKDMMAKKGRARFLGERSRGFVDAGSVSVVLIFQGMRDCLKEEVYA